MSDTTASLRHKLKSAGDLQAVVRTMKSLAASSINQYEQSVRALGDYARTVELGLGVCFRGMGHAEALIGDAKGADSGVLGAVVFGSDQGLVGQFNDLVADHAVKTLVGLTDSQRDQSPSQLRVWAVGERVQARLADAGLPLAGLFNLPSSVAGIAPLVGEILVAIEADEGFRRALPSLHLIYNRPSQAAAYAPVDQRLLPLDEPWRRSLAEAPWPTNNLPEVIGGATGADIGADIGANTGGGNGADPGGEAGGDTRTPRALIREYLFVSLFRACAESLASENASRLAAMQRADKNIEDLLETLNGDFHRLRQSGIDAELFDVIAGFKALAEPRRSTQGQSLNHQDLNQDLNHPDRREATMLITFQTKAYANITMFGDVAVTLIKLMGHSGAVPSALLADEVPAALVHLKAAVEAQPDEPLDPTNDPADDADEGQHVSLAHRALPLIELLTAAAAAHEDVMWDE